MPSPLKVVFFSLRDSYIEEGNCFHDTSNARLIHSLMGRIACLSLITYQDFEPKSYYNFNLKPYRLYVLPFRNTFINGILRTNRILKVLKKAESENDILILQYPFKSFLTPFFLKKPSIVHLCSNLLTASRNPVKYKGIRRLFAAGYAGLLHRANKSFFKRKNVRIITNGNELAELYKQYSPVPVISSSIYLSEIIRPDQIRRRNETFAILFVGRPSLEKGFDTLLTAFKTLSVTFPIHLHCVGFSEKEFSELYEKPTWLNEAQITFHGAIPFSDELFSIYRFCDVLVLPSRSEGTPRVLVEARAFGCPVIATRVGGIPDSVSDREDGLLFDAGMPDQLIQLLTELINNESTRLQLVRNGIERAKSQTAERFSDVFFKAMSEFELQ